MAEGRRPKPCPFCGISLVFCAADYQIGLYGEWVSLQYWKHGKNGCFLDGAEVQPDEVLASNERAC